jgi:hypothetical protein
MFLFPFVLAVFALVAVLIEFVIIYFSDAFSHAYWTVHIGILLFTV